MTDSIFTLKFFKSIVWVDSNQDIVPQVNVFINLIGNTLQYYNNIKDASKFVSQNRSYNLIVMTSSRMIKQVYEAFRETSNVYPKYFIFCGTYGRAYEMKNYSPYKDVVAYAHWEPFDIIQDIINLEQILIRDPGAMNRKITINFVPQTPIIVSKQQSLTKIQQKYTHTAPTVLAPSPKKQKKQKKTHQKILIIWVLQKQYQSYKPNQLKILKDKYFDNLQNQGFPIDLKQYVDILQQKLYDIQEQVVFIVPTNITLPTDMQQSIHRPRLMIRLQVDQVVSQDKKEQFDSQQYCQDFTYVENMQRLIQILKNSGLDSLKNQFYQT